MKTILLLPARSAPVEVQVACATDPYQYLLNAAQAAGIESLESQTIWVGPTKAGRGSWTNGTASVTMHFDEGGLLKGLTRNANVLGLVGPVFVVAMETSNDGEEYRYHDYNRYLTKDSVLTAVELWAKGRIVDERVDRMIAANAARMGCGPRPAGDFLAGVNIEEYKKMKQELQGQLDAL